MEITITAKEEGFDVVDLGEILPDMPKFDDSGDLVVSDIPGATPVAVKVVEKTPEPEKEKNWHEDGDHSKFIVYLNESLQKIPPHSGETTVGCERAIAFLKRLDREISKAVQSDEKNIIDEVEAERLRDQIMDYVGRLEDAHSTLTEAKNKKRKKASQIRVHKEVVARINDGDNIQYYVAVAQGDREELLPVSLAEPSDEQVQLFVRGEMDSGLTKEASPKVVLFEDPFLHAITRILINAHVSGGRNIEEVYANLKKKYSFTSREELSVQELLTQKGMPIFKDFGRDHEEGQPSDGKGIDHSTTYYA